MTYIDLINLIERLEPAFVALVGALVGGSFALRGVYLAHEMQEKNELKIFLRSIHSEVSTIWERYKSTYKPYIDDLPEGEILNREYPLKQDYFTIYNNNTNLLGKIQDAELRKDIIHTYLLAKGLVDSLLSNNDMLEKYNQICWILSQETSSANQGVKLGFQKELLDYAPKIKQQSNELEKNVQKLIGKLNGYAS